MEILKILIEEQLLMKYYVLKHLVLLQKSQFDGYLPGLGSRISYSFDKTSSTHLGTGVTSDT